MTLPVPMTLELVEELVELLELQKRDAAAAFFEEVAGHKRATPRADAFLRALRGTIRSARAEVAGAGDYYKRRGFLVVTGAELELLAGAIGPVALAPRVDVDALKEKIRLLRASVQTSARDSAPDPIGCVAIRLPELVCTCEKYGVPPPEERLYPSVTGDEADHCMGCRRDRCAANGHARASTEFREAVAFAPPIGKSAAHVLRCPMCGDVKLTPVCGSRSPRVLVAGAWRCNLEPRHGGPHRTTTPAAAGAGVYVEAQWPKGEEEEDNAP